MQFLAQNLRLTYSRYAGQNNYQCVVYYVDGNYQIQMSFFTNADDIAIPGLDSPFQANLSSTFKAIQNQVEVA